VSPLSRPYAVLAVLVLAVMASALAAVYAKHQNRKLFTEMQALIAERDQLDVDWSRLQIEQSAWSTHARVEQLARGEMGMRSPRPEEQQLVVR
jgi:cell division protein FtsL